MPKFEPKTVLLIPGYEPIKISDKLMVKFLKISKFKKKINNAKHINFKENNTCNPIKSLPTNK